MRIITALLSILVISTSLKAQDSESALRQISASVITEESTTNAIIQSLGDTAIIDTIMPANTEIDEGLERDSDEGNQNLRVHTIFLFPMLLFEVPFALLKHNETEHIEQKNHDKTEPVKQKKKRKWLKTYDPQIPSIWYGNSMLLDGIFGSSSTDFHLRNGVSKHYEIGITAFEIAKNLYGKYLGVSAAAQLYAGFYHFEKNTLLMRSHQNIDFVEAESPLKKNRFDYAGFRFPVLVGYQTPYKIFSIKTGLAIGTRGVDSKNYTYKYSRDKKESESRLHINWFSTDWMTVVGLGPLTVTYKQGLLHLFKTTSGKKAYESSLTFGIDLNWLFRMKEL